MRTSAIALALAAASGLVGCGADFDPGSRIVSLRVLAIRADNPYAKPGETVHLDSLWYDALDPDRTKRSREWAWATCVNPDSSSVFDCFKKIAVDAATTGKPPQFTLGTDVDTFTFTVPSDALSSLPPEALPNALVGVITIVCPGTLQLPDPSQPLDPNVFPVQCIDDTGRSLGLDEF